MEKHSAALKGVCRVGGARISRVSDGRAYLVTGLVDELQSAFGIDVTHDDPDVHPPNICILCERVVRRVTQSGATHCGGGCGPLTVWSPHTRVNCAFCASVSESAKGGRPKKKKKSLTGSALQKSLAGSALQEATSQTEHHSHDLPVNVLSMPSATCNSLPPPVPVTIESEDCEVSVEDANEPDMSAEAPTPMPPLQCTDDIGNCSLGTGMDVSFDSVLAKATPSYRTQFADLLPERFLECYSDLKCSVCRLVVDQVVETPCCQHVFCAACICYWLESSTQCPQCSSELYASALLSPHRIIRGILSEMQIYCDFYDGPYDGCAERVPLGHLEKHTQSCHYHPDHSSTHTAQPRVVSQSFSVGDVLNASPSKLRGNVCDQLTKHLVMSTAVGDRLELRNTGHGGRPIVWTRTPIPLVDSSVASDRSKRRRASQVRAFRSEISGGKEGSFAQSVHEFKGMGRKERDDLLVKAKLNPLSPAAGTALAIKSDLHLPWYQLRKLQKWFVSFGISLESERISRQYLKDAMPKYAAEQVPMTGKQGISLVPMVYTKDLPALILHLLSLHDEAGTLVQHSGMGEDEIWVKFCGDHGGNSFKLCLQLLNIQHPNSVRNTVPVCVFLAKDSPSNLETGLGLYREQLQELMTSTQWKGKSFRIVLSGDYEFLTTNYGLSGSSGVRPCLFCVCEKKAMQIGPTERDSVEPRSLASLQSDHDSFQKAGGNLSRAKYHNNVIRPAILPFPLEDVCIPTLHLDLGIYPWLFDALSTEVRDLDLLLAKSSALAPVNSDSDDFKLLAEACITLQSISDAHKEVEAQCTLIQEQLSFLITHAQRHGFTSQIQAAASTMQLQWQTAQQQVSTQQATLEQQKAKVAQLEGKVKSGGPCYQSLDKVLAANNIQRQAYHGGAFIGNHVHHALQSAVIDQLTAAPLHIVQERIELCSSTGLTPKQQEELAHLKSSAENIKARYGRLMSEFAACRKIYSSAEQPTSALLQILSDAIAMFLATCRQEIVCRKLGNITPKLHLLECHILDCMKHFNVGLGLLNEQGSESIHSAFNKLQRTYASMVSHLDRLKSCTEAHLQDTIPRNSQLRPVTSSRKRKRSESDDDPQRAAT